MRKTPWRIGLALILATLASAAAHAQLIIQDNFTGASSSYDWKAFNGACLTAGNGTGTIPACVGLPYYQGQTLVGGANGTLPDPVGNGALRFTNGYTQGMPSGNFDYGFNQAGGIISNFTFPSNEGLEVTFTAISYRGNSGGTGGDGADGISFFLMDGSYPAYDTGAFGGSLGYSCSNTNNDQTQRADGTVRGYDGLAGAYIGLGVDEYGNFLNPGDNTASGPGYQWSRIGLRGAGDITWAQLSANDSSDYPSTLPLQYQAEAVQHTCASGRLWNFSNYTSPKETSTTVLDYPYINGTASLLPNNQQIADESALTRGDAVPITYKLKITSAGLLSFSYSYNGGVYQPVITDQDITASNGTVPSTFRFGFAGSTGGSTNVHEIMCFRAEPSDVANGSAGINQKETAEVQTGTQVYFAYYNPNNWAGSLTANNLVFDATTNTIAIASLANWDASCVLTGVASGSTCSATGGGAMSAESPSTRAILTWNGSNGIPFEWTSLTPSQQAGLAASNRLDYLRGDRSNELTPEDTGLYRDRGSVLGDIIDSSPTWVGPPSSPYQRGWADSLYPTATAPEASGETYSTFESDYATRENVVYVSANDGLLHGFRAGAYESNGTWNPEAQNDGEEVLAYMPDAVLNVIHSATNPAIDFSSPNYGHEFYVDASPGTGDLFYNGAWHTWLVGGLGYGGSALFVLDITDPTQFQESNAATLVKGEWTPATVSCVNDSSCGQDFGNVGGEPEIRRFHNGEWGVVFGNGLNSESGHAGIFVMLVDSTGTPSFYYLDTPATSGDGIVYVTPADLDSDHIVDYVYAGDAKGNVWRFDLTSADPSQWSVRSTPIFTTPSGQPITTQLTVGGVTSSTGEPRVLVAFGTGQQFPLTNTGAATYATGQQALYGIWDWDMTGWDAKGSVQMASLPSPQTVTIAQLEAQSVTGSTAPPAGGLGNGYRTVSDNTVCWQGDTGCSTGQFGWVLPLPSTGEQVIYSPNFQYGAFIVNTFIPATGSPTNCSPTTPTGWTMAVSIATGGAFSAPIFVTPDHHFIVYKDAPISGLELNGTGTPSIVTTSVPDAGVPNESYLVTQTVSGLGAIAGINGAAGAHGKRLTWAQLR